MYAKPHPRAEVARELRVYAAHRRANERSRRNAEAMARVYEATGYAEFLASLGRAEVQS